MHNYTDHANEVQFAQGAHNIDLWNLCPVCLVFKRPVESSVGSLDMQHIMSTNKLDRF